MNSAKTDTNFPVNPRQVAKLPINSIILLVMAAMHLLLQLKIASITSGKPVTDLPQTAESTLIVLLLLFSGLEISLFLFVGKFGPKLREQTSVFLFMLVPAALSAVLVFRVPYSSILLIWGMTLQIFLWYLTAWTLEKLNKPIIGVTALSREDFEDLISSEFIHVISPEISDPIELDLIVLKESELSSPEWSEFLMLCFLNSVIVEEQSNFIEKLNGQVNLNQFSFRNSLHLVRENKYLPIKRLIDISASAVSLVLLMPVLAFISLIIRLDSRGNPIFSQQRVGMGGKPFTMYKFRTMRTTFEGAPAKFAEKQDTRITRIGKFFRKTRIDELPQLWNVFIGDMSLIGPRPEQTGLLSAIQTEIPLFSLRHSIRPGITGWAQVRQGYADDMLTTQS
jgi:lipopolysaccharide/colanic/teichoic acid biosynthesis glycosyltransferase